MVEAGYEVDAVIYLTRNSPRDLEDLPVEGKDTVKSKYTKIKKLMRNRGVFRNILYYEEDTNGRAKEASLYGFFENCLLSEHGEIKLFLKHYLSVVKIFGGEKMNEDLKKRFFKIFQDLSETTSDHSGVENVGFMIDDAYETKEYYQKELYKAVKEKWKDSEEEKGILWKWLVREKVSLSYYKYVDGVGAMVWFRGYYQESEKERRYDPFFLQRQPIE